MFKHKSHLKSHVISVHKIIIWRKRTNAIYLFIYLLSMLKEDEGKVVYAALKD